MLNKIHYLVLQQKCVRNTWIYNVLNAYISYISNYNTEIIAAFKVPHYLTETLQIRIEAVSVNQLQMELCSFANIFIKNIIGNESTMHLKITISTLSLRTVQVI